MKNFLKEFKEDFIALAINVDKAEVGVRIGHPILRYAFDKLLPDEYIIKNTSYNRQILKWFRYEGIDTNLREIRFYSRLRIMKFTDKPWPLNGTWTTYDNAWDVNSGLNLEVENRSIKGDVKIRHIDADWPSGLGGIFFSIIDTLGGSLSWIVTGKFTTISDIISNIGATIFNLADVGNISGYLQEIDNLNQRGLIYLQRTEYESNGVWMWYTIDPNRVRETYQRLENDLKKRGWL